MKRSFVAGATLTAACLSLFAAACPGICGPLCREMQTADSLAQEPAEPVDSVWSEATADGALNFMVFGRYARDDAHFDRLKERFEAADSTLLFSDRMTLYYGMAYRDEYEGGYSIDNGIAKLIDSLPAEVYACCLERLRTTPSSARLLHYALIAGRLCDRPAAELDRLSWRFWKTLALIYSMGEGTEKDPFVVTSVSDEYELMYSWLEVERVTGQQLIDNDGVSCDRMAIDPVDNEYFRGSEVWFDVSFCLPMFSDPRHWAKKLAAADEED